MRMSFVAVVLLFASAPAQAGVVQTATARLEGKVAVDAGQVTVDGKKVNWPDVLYYVSDAIARQPARAEQVSLRNGEVWTAELAALSGKSLDVRSALLGDKKLDLSKVAALDFGPRLPLEKVGTLIRIKGEPVFGALLAIKEGKVVIDSVVGEIDLPRNTLAGYRYVPDGPRLGAGDDWVYLTDGTILRGQLVPQEQGFQLIHATGPLKLPAGFVAGVVRHQGRTLDLAESRPWSFTMKSILPTGGESAPRPVEGGGFVKGLQFEPKTAAKYKLDGTKAGKLRALLLPSAGAVGDSRVTIKVAGKILLERDVTPTSRAEPIAFDVRGGDELEVIVDFGGQVRFPCGVVLGDPHMAWN